MPIGTRRETAKRAIRKRRWRKPPLYVKQILAWVDEHREITGQWPTTKSGRVLGTLEERWDRIDAALVMGLRGLPGGDSLPRLLARFRGVRNRKALPPYTFKQILTWADAHYERHGEWPHQDSGAIADAPGETWTAVAIALSHGRRGLPGGTSLAKLLAKHRGMRNIGDLPAFRLREILAWADAHHRSTGMWPTHLSGPIADAPGETWFTVDKALRDGTRGMRGGSSLPRLLKRGRKVPLKHRRQPPLTIDQILTWADEHHERTGTWPNVNGGPIPSAPGETWGKMQIALAVGKRGLKGNSSLAKLLAEHRGVRNIQDLPDFTIDQILAWADDHFKRHGRWPGHHGGSIAGAPQETWTAVGLALSRGLRGLAGGTSLAKLLAEHRGVRNHGDLPKFTVDDALSWADAHFERTGTWPTDRSGPIVEAPEETWANVDRALRRGLRGLRGSSSLARLLKRQRGVLPKQRRKPRLSLDEILKWADDYYSRHGHWPTPASGPIQQMPGDSWQTVQFALQDGKRGLEAGLSLGKLWSRYRGVRNVYAIAKLSEHQILAWADAFYSRTGQWPQVRSGPIAESPTDNWLSVENALRLGLRGLSGGSSLKKFLDEHRRNREPIREPAGRRRRKPRRLSKR